jgi:hypothetical protein
MPVKLTTIVSNIEKFVLNQTNADLIRDFHKFMKNNRTSESYQKNNLKTIINFANFLGSEVCFYEIQRNLVLFLPLYSFESDDTLTMKIIQIQYKNIYMGKIG